MLQSLIADALPRAKGKRGDQYFFLGMGAKQNCFETHIVLKLCEGHQYEIPYQLL